jgi:DMSO/TMAO reductase YedYZ molybdopterin-dependent catalytic subunit
MPKAEAHFVMLHSADGYTTNLPREDFAAMDALLAHSWNGAPLTREHGGPMRLVVPHLYFWKSAKWLQRIEFIAADRPVSGKSAATTCAAIRGKSSATRTIRDTRPSFSRRRWEKGRVR